MVIRVCVEGGNSQDENAPLNIEYREALGKVFPYSQHDKKIRWIPSGGKREVDTRFRKLVESRFKQLRANDEIVLMLKDSDGLDLDELRGKVIEGINRNKISALNADTDIHFMVQAIEAWFLADEKTIRSKYKPSNGEFPVSDPEAIPDPKGTLISITGGSYESKNAPELLREMDRDVVYNECPAFQRFDERLKNA